MRPVLIAAIAAAFLASCSTLTQAPSAGPDAQAPGANAAAEEPAGPGPGPAAGAEPEVTAQPPTPVPNALPPAPPGALPPPPVQQPQAQALPPATGQWVYTAQYGWAWMPYGPQYVYVPVESDDYPYQFVFLYGGAWGWVRAPWIWGRGVVPWYGPWGPRRFSWYHGPDFYPPSRFVRRHR